MTTIEGTDTERAVRTALAAIEQMFDEAMTYIEARYEESISGSSEEATVDHEQGAQVHPVEEGCDPTEEITCQAA